MNIAILGTRGIPNNYGGFEQFAEYLAKGLVEKGHDVTVYSSHNHPHTDKVWEKVEIIHQYDPENRIGTAGQFIYDFNCIVDTRKRRFDVILQLGYTSNSIWASFLPKKAVIVTNMDGLEWKRSKYRKIVQKYLLFAEKWAVDYSDYLISDSVAIQEYLMSKYKADSEFIPYGASIFNNPNFEIVRHEYEWLAKYEYNMLIARMEPENNIEIILDGFFESGSDKLFLVVGGYANKFGKYLVQKYSTDDRIKFLGGVYNLNLLNNLRHFSNVYFHGHSVGGTNPSLLEAMASNALICAHDNLFNRSILGNDALYFNTAEEVQLIANKTDKSSSVTFLMNNKRKIQEHYSWNVIVDKYEDFLKRAVEKGKTNRKLL